jgi:hypothetical protein
MVANMRRLRIMVDVEVDGPYCAETCPHLALVQLMTEMGVCRLESTRGVYCGGSEIVNDRIVWRRTDKCMVGAWPDRV